MKFLLSVFILMTATAYAQSPRAYERPGYRELASEPEAKEEKPRQEGRREEVKSPPKAPEKKPEVSQ